MKDNLFSTPFWKIKVPNHQSIKEKYLQSFIDGYEKKIFNIPEDWVTHKCHTSFKRNKILEKDICDEYSSVLNSIIEKNGKVKLNIGGKYIKIMNIKNGIIICPLHYLPYIF